MAKTRGDLLVTLAKKLVGKAQLYGFLTDSSGSAVLDAGGNEQVSEVQIGENGRLKVDAVINESLPNVILQKWEAIAYNLHNLGGNIGAPTYFGSTIGTSGGNTPRIDISGYKDLSIVIINNTNVAYGVSVYIDRALIAGNLLSVLTGESIAAGATKWYTTVDYSKLNMAAIGALIALTAPNGTGAATSGSVSVYLIGRANV